MKRLKLILPIIIIAFLIVGCESKKIRNAEEFMILEDWENCIANLKAEITDNPRNLKAYQLLYDAQKQLYYPNYNQDLFLNPFEVNFKDQKIISLSSVEAINILTTIKSIKKIDSTKATFEQLFFVAINKFLSWKEQTNNNLGIINNEDNCQSTILAESIAYFQLCSSINSEYADNAYLWWFYAQCNNSKIVNHFIDSFKKKHGNSEVINEVKFIDLLNKIEYITDSWLIIPTTEQSENILNLVNSFLISQPHYENRAKIIDGLLIDRFYDGYLMNRLQSALNEFSGGEDLVNYLKMIYRSDSINLLRASALEKLILYYIDTDQLQAAMENYESIKTLNLSDEINSPLNQKIGVKLYNSNEFERSLEFLKSIEKKTDRDYYLIWRCYINVGNMSEANLIHDDLKYTTDPNIKYLISIYNPELIKITSKYSKIENQTVIIGGYINNASLADIHNIRILGTASDEFGENKLYSYDTIDYISSGERSIFSVEIYYGSSIPSSIQFEVSIEDFKRSY